MDENLVLVVDDDALSRHVLTKALEQFGFPWHAASSGEEAITFLGTNTPGIVLLDLIMPAPDGYAVLRAMRTNAATKDIPVVVLTGVDAEEEVSRAFEMGADDFIRKPFKNAELVARIRSQLRIRSFVEVLARREHDARVVLELTQALASTLDFRSILYTVVRRIAEVARVDRCSIILVRDDMKIGYVVAASDDRELRDLPIDLSKYPEINRVLETGEPLLIDDATTHPVFDLVRPLLPADTFRSFACLPILHDAKPLGVLFLRRKNPGTARDHELWVARTIASATAIALRNARIMQSLKDQTRESTYARFEAERKIRALEPYAEFFHSAAEGIVVIDAEGTVLFSNPRAGDILGVATTTFFERVSPDQRQAFREMARRVDLVDKSEPRDFEVVVETPNMAVEKRTLSVSFVGLGEDEENAVLLSFRDVTDDRATEHELTKTKEFLERVIESSVDTIISADNDGTIRLFNRAAERCFGYLARDVVGKLNVKDLYPVGLAHETMRLIKSEEHGGTGRLEGYRTEVLARDGSRVPVLVSAALIVDDGRPVGSVGVMTDLRDRLEMEANLSEAREALRSREKQALIAELAGAAAHELNQPLTSVLGYAEIMRRRAKLGQPIHRETEAVVSEAERMAEIVRKIGKITKYETKAYVGEAKIIDIEASAEDVNKDSGLST